MKGKLFTGNFISVHRSYNRQEIILDNRNNPISAVHRPDHYMFCHLDWPRAHHSFQGSFSKVEGGGHDSNRGVTDRPCPPNSFFIIENWPQ